MMIDLVALALAWYLLPCWLALGVTLLVFWLVDAL